MAALRDRQTTVFALLQENAKTQMDAANLAEKLGIFENAETLVIIRELRNQIAHEYVGSDLNALFLDVLRYVPELAKFVHGFRAYCRRFEEKV